MDALPAFAAGLRLDPRGDALLRELEVDARPTPHVALRAETAPPLAQGLGWLAELPTIRARIAFVVRSVFPPPDFMRVWAPSARRGSVVAGRRVLLAAVLDGSASPGRDPGVAPGSSSRSSLVLGEGARPACAGSGAIEDEEREGPEDQRPECQRRGVRLPPAAGEERIACSVERVAKRHEVRARVEAIRGGR